MQKIRSTFRDSLIAKIISSALDPVKTGAAFVGSLRRLGVTSVHYACPTDWRPYFGAR